MLVICDNVNFSQNCSLDLDLSRFSQVYCRISLQDSRSFVGDPPHLTLNHGFPVIRLSRPKEIAWADAHSSRIGAFAIEN